MPDIIMCGNESCPLKMKCYRFTAIPTPDRQAYAFFSHKDGRCDAFWDNTGQRSRFDNHIADATKKV